MEAWDLLLKNLEVDGDSDSEDEEGASPIKRRRVYERKDWRVSGWALELQELAVEGLTPSSRSARRFRKDFRIPYPFFLELVALVKVAWLA